MVRKKSITIWDVAREAGVSGKTVSRVLNDEPMVDANTRAQVLEVMERMGYVPNIQARRLASGSSRVLGLLFKGTAWGYLNTVFASVIDTARQAHFTILPIIFDPELPEEYNSVLGLIAQHRPDGMIFTPPCDNSPELIDALVRRKMPFVRLTPQDRSAPLPYVHASDYRGAYEMTAYLIGLGHRHIAHISGQPSHQASHERLAGYRDALEKHGLPYQPDLVFPGDWSFEGGLECARRILAAKPRVSAIFAGNDEMAAGALAAAHAQAIPVPQALSITGFDDVAIAQKLWPPLTTMRQPIRQIAELSTRLLLDLIQGRSPAVLQHELPTELVVRASSGPYPGASGEASPPE